MKTAATNIPAAEKLLSESGNDFPPVEFCKAVISHRTKRGKENNFSFILFTSMNLTAIERIQLGKRVSATFTQFLNDKKK